MPTYNCECCQFTTLLKSNHTNHLLTKKHIRNSQQVVNKKSALSQQKVNPEPTSFVCKYCEHPFKFKQSMYRHIKYSCTKNKTEDLTELVRLMNLQIETQRNQIQNQTKQIDTQHKQIEKLMGKLDIHGTFNTTINHIQLLNYKDTDVSHLTDADYRRCIKKVCFCVMNLIEKVHYNPDKPENMNIYISNLKDKYLMVYEDGKWLLKNKKEINRLYEEKELMLEEWIEENKDPEMDKFFSRYLDLKKDNKTMLLIQDELKLMMFNQKDRLPMIENGS